MNYKFRSSCQLILVLQICVQLLFYGEAASETIGNVTLEDIQPAGGKDFSANLPREEGVKLDVGEIVKKSDEFLQGVFGEDQELDFHSATLRGQTTQEGIVWVWQIYYIHPESKVKSRLFNPRLLSVRVQLNGDMLTRVVQPEK